MILGLIKLTNKKFNFCLYFITKRNNISFYYIFKILYSKCFKRSNFYQKNLSKAYLNAFFEIKLPKNCKWQKARKPFIYKALRAYLPQHCLYLRPLPHGHGSFLPTFFVLLGVLFTFSLPSFVYIFCFLGSGLIFCLI